MAPLRLFDTLTREKVEFVPRVPGEVSLYVCGLTVQDAPHVGHALSAVAFDVLRRHLTRRGLRVRLVRNLTDVDDKIVARAAAEGTTPEALAERSIAALHLEMDALGVLPPDVEPRVTLHVPEIVALVERLVTAGHAYPAGGDVYFAVSTFAAYGALSGQSVDALVAGARVEPGVGKRSPEDFALWKAAKAGEPSWPSPWGEGRPGWHIECSAMALAHLGPAFDLHGGGVDLVFPHHENEIAQSVAALGEGSFARRWFHNGLLEVSGSKMSKSLGNFRHVSDVRARYGAEALRFFLVSHHPRAAVAYEEVDGTLPGVADADRRLAYLYATLERIDAALLGVSDPGPGPLLPAADRFLAAFDAALDDDLNTPLAVAEIGEAAKSANRLLEEPRSVPSAVRLRTLAAIARDVREAASSVLGVLGRDARSFREERRARLASARGVDLASVRALLAERDAARRAKDFARADAARSRLAGLGVEVMDGPLGADWRVAE